MECVFKLYYSRVAIEKPEKLNENDRNFLLKHSGQISHYLKEGSNLDDIPGLADLLDKNKISSDTKKTIGFYQEPPSDSEQQNTTTGGLKK